MVPVDFVYEKIHAHPFIDKLYWKYQMYRKSSVGKRMAVFKIFTHSIFKTDYLQCNF